MRGRGKREERMPLYTYIYTYIHIYIHIYIYIYIYEEGGAKRGCPFQDIYDIKALLRLYQPIKAQLRLNSGSIKALLRLD
jgi:hypothetical protein